MSFLSNVIAIPQIPEPGSSNGWRPPQWSRPQLTSVTCLLPNNQSSAPSANVPTATTFFFDAVLRLDHVQEMRITDHPVQNGASISDHAYLLPARLVLEVGFSDVMDSVQTGQYSGASTKSVSAYQQFLQLQALRIPLTVTTRLKQYTNMVVEAIHAPDTHLTVTAARFTLQFRQIIIGTVTTQPQSSRPSQVNSNNEGNVPSQPFPPNYYQFINGNGQISSESGASIPQ